jgi:uncharacterized membrane protein YkvA (DUF1232 family)
MELSDVFIVYSINFRQENKLKSNKILRWQDIGGNFFQNALLRFKLTIRLMLDRRINIWLKLIPVFSLAYLILPLDIPGPVDDAVVLWFGMDLFIELCPQDTVMEYTRELQKSAAQTNVEPPQDVVDADFKEIKKDD